MEIKKLAPWNWFKKQDEHAGRPLPVRHDEARDRSQAPGHPLAQFHQGMDRLFNSLLSDFGAPAPFRSLVSLLPDVSTTLLKPTLDIASTDKAYTVAVEIPGVDEKDVQLELLDGALTIRGEKKRSREDKGRDYYCVERSYGAFHRVLSLPGDVDENAISASFNKGVLDIILPRRAMPRSEDRQIEIKAAA